jgi:hypothetical protein
MVWQCWVSRMSVRRWRGSRQRGGRGAALGSLGVTIDVTITLLLRDPLAWSYKAILMPSVSLVRDTLLSLGTGGPTRRHATALTQSDFRVSERELLRTTSARNNQGERSLVQQLQRGWVDPNIVVFGVVAASFVSFRGRRCGEVWIAEVKDGSRWLLLVACFGGWDLR